MTERFCEICGREILDLTDTATNIKYCSARCRYISQLKPKNRDKRKREIKKRIEKQKRFEEIIRQADLCGMSYGKYTAALRMGKTFEELKNGKSD